MAYQTLMGLQLTMELTVEVVVAMMGVVESFFRQGKKMTWKYDHLDTS